MPENVLIVGATSAIARALCHRLAARGCDLVLAGRSGEELARTARDLEIRYRTSAFVETFEALDCEGHPAFLDRCLERAGGNLEGSILCYGWLPDQAETERDFTEARRTVDVNFVSVVSLLHGLAKYFEERKGGYIAAVSSVAGDRGRQSNYVYGAAKAALNVFLQGLRNRLWSKGVHVLTIKPGFVDTPMTWGLVDHRSPLVATPAKVAQDIERAIRRRKNVLYTPWFWRTALTLVCALPEPLFKRMRL